jgi:membrane protein DedA with SNARE-associated domain
MIDFLVEHVSYAGIMLALILTGTGLPIPEEVIVIIAGVGASQGALKSAWLAYASCLAGALLGDLVTYGIGHHFGRNVLREHPRVVRFLTPAREAQIEEMIRRHGLKVFFIARFMVGLRSPVYLTAGILRVPFRRFIIADTFCATTVISLFFFLSYRFAPQVEGWWEWIRHAELAFTLAIVAAVIGVVAFFYVRHRRYLANLPPHHPDRLPQANAHEPGSNGSSATDKKNESKSVA